MADDRAAVPAHEQTVAPPQRSSAPASTGSGTGMVAELLALQKTVGNASAAAFVQAKLIVGAADDPAEREADEVAASVLSSMRNGTAPPPDDPKWRPPSAKPVAHRAAPSGDDPLGGLEVDDKTSRSIDSARGGGAPLPGALRAQLEPRFGADFSSVRVHTDSRAEALNRSLQARAFATGTDLFFGKGEYSPSSAAGQEVLAHELAHVVQQSDSNPRRRIRRLATVKEFKTSTDEGFFTKRGEALKAIDEWLKEWETLSKEKGSKSKATKQEQLLLQMKYATEQWIEDHTIKETGEEDPGRKKRMIGMKAFLGSISSELVTVRKVMTGSYQQGPTDDVDITTAGKNFKKLKSKYEGNAKSTLNKLAWMIDAAVPNKGDESELEIEFRWPVDPSGIAFVGGRLRANAQRDSTVGAAAGEQSGVTVRCELVVTFGGQWLDLAEAKGELGGYFEASAKNSVDATTLISYSMYRRWRESFVLPDGAANYIWGGRGGSYGKAKAEQWSNSVEKQVFGGKGNEESYVESGGLASVGGKVGVKKGNLGGAELEGKLTYTNGTRYDKGSIESTKGVGNLGAKNKKSKNAKLSDAQEKLGRTVQTLNFMFSATAGPITGEVNALGKWLADKSQEQAVTKQQLDSVELEFSGKAAVPTAGHGDLVSKVIRYLGPGLMSLVKIIRRGVESKSQASKGEGQKAKNLGAVFGSLEDGVPAISQILKLGEQDGVDFSKTKDAVGELGQSDAASKLKDGANISNAKADMGVESTAGIKLSIGVNCLEPEVQITLAYEKDMEFKIPGFLSVKAVKSERIVSVSMAKKDGWKPEFS